MKTEAISPFDMKIESGEAIGNEAQSFEGDSLAEYIFGGNVSKIPATFVKATEQMAIWFTKPKSLVKGSVTKEKGQIVWKIELGSYRATYEGEDGATHYYADGKRKLEWSRPMTIRETNPKVDSYGEEHGYTESRRMQISRQVIIQLASKLKNCESKDLAKLTSKANHDVLASLLPKEEWKLKVWQVAITIMLHQESQSAQ